MNWLNYHHLFYFKTIVEQGSIAKASEILRIGQPALSMQLKQLEDQFDKKLFLREKRSLILTDTGKTVYYYAKEIFKLGTELVDTVNDLTLSKTRIQIGVQDCVPKNLIAKLTSFIYQENNTSISIYSADMNKLIDGVVNHEFDLIMLNSAPPTKDKAILFSKRVLRSHVSIAGAKNFLQLKKGFPKSLDHQPMIVPTSHSQLRHDIELFFNSKNLNLNIIGESQDTVIQKNMAIAGNGLIPIMNEAIGTYLKSKQLYIIGELPEIHDDIWIVVAKRKILNPIADRIIEKFNID
jgi:LysR family transcriptional activator of nhaA